MSRFFRYLATAGLIAVSLESSVALTQAIGSRRRLCPLSLKCRHAAGHLIPSSQFTGNEFTHQIITHFFGPNPDPSDNGAIRATWQSSPDTSAVWAATVPDGTSNDPKL